MKRIRRARIEIPDRNVPTEFTGTEQSLSRIAQNGQTLPRRRHTFYQRARVSVQVPKPPGFPERYQGSTGMTIFSRERSAHLIATSREVDEQTEFVARARLRHESHGTCARSPDPNWIPRTGIGSFFMARDSRDEECLYGINATILPVVDEPLTTDIWRRILE